MSTSNPTFGAPLLPYFPFQSDYLNINHGSFGGYPIKVRDALREYQRQTDAKPDDFIRYRLPGLIDKSRAAVAELINADVGNVVLIPNATTGVNTVLRNLVYNPGDKIVYLGTTYGACEKAVMHIVDTCIPAGAVEAIKVEVEYPVTSKEILRRFEDAISQKGVRIALFDTVSSLPALRLPYENMISLCKKYHVLSLIDGAHAVGAIELDMQRLDPDFFISNLHKWLYTPRSCAVFHVAARSQHLIKTSLPTSHGYRPEERPGRLRVSNPLPTSSKTGFVELFGYVGTMDYTPYLCIPEAIKFRKEVCGGEQKLLQYITTLAKQGGNLVANILGTELLGDEDQRRSPMVMVRLPLKFTADELQQGKQHLLLEEIERTISEKYRTFVPLIYHGGHAYGRLSGQVYLTLEDFEKAGQILAKACKEFEQKSKL
ncbi:cysteine desulfurylase, putative [Talaromyces stipitatus ATCC 10500]|uniref:Cysteine desulfurylase, putative n=1 Tax=Talaromyces stipitatus (strain ATCC 10500 / CBS 375.48 / QM 6759 / NRRL 1006) TaxID=441959 RepID=B8MB08_TALSN|nr:cysteine desulfurylase, putative [Talaromyces stipitatus ATCC 10500]EED18709.1 cysteine desulfurylase, putative [Talaromyces stipitatus ATCC 10500]